MFDINFFKKVSILKEQVVRKKKFSSDADDIITELESFRSQKPFVFNVETTNICNMTCQMCPRTNEMTRPIQSISDTDFSRVIKQVNTHGEEELDTFWDFIQGKYGNTEAEESENSFYFYVVSKSLILHGYGEPLLDKKILERVSECTQNNIPTYFSCVPANINIEKITKLMDAGLGVIKFSMDALDDDSQKDIRGKQNDFEKSYQKILEVLNYKLQNNKIKTKIVITMISFSHNEITMQENFLKLWEKHDVYAYIKSQDNRWLFKKDDDEYENKSHYESQYCEYPWSSLTVMANGDVVPCTQDFNNEMVMGNVKSETLSEIWNGEKYRAFREFHVTGNFEFNLKCRDYCDQKKLYHYLDK